MRITFSSENHLQVHDRIKRAIERLYGKVRDFDETLRKTNYEKLSKLYEMVGEHVPRKIIHTIFYSIKDEWRILKSAEELSPLITHTFSSVEMFLEGAVKSEEEPYRVFSSDYGGRRITTVVSAQEIQNSKGFEDFGELVAELNIYGHHVQTYVK